MNKEEKEIFDKILEEKVIDFIKKYKDRPFYLKVPLWVFEDLKESFMGLMKIDYISGRFSYEGLYICETITIDKLEEIEVF